MRAGRLAGMLLALGGPAMAQGGGVQVHMAGLVTPTATLGATPDAMGTSVASGLRVSSGQVISIAADAYGFYDSAVALGAIAGGAPSQHRVGFLGGFEAGVPAMAGYGGIDRGGAFIAAFDRAPAFTIQGATIGPRRVMLATPLTAAQMALLRPHMFLTTNNAASRPDSTWETWITGWDPGGRFIDVVGWTEAGLGHVAPDQVPAGSTGGAPQTILVSPANNLFGANIVCSIDGPARGGTARNCIGIEADVINNTGAYQDDADGYTAQAMGGNGSNFAFAARGSWRVGFDIGAADFAGFTYGGALGAGGYGYLSQQTTGYPFVYIPRGHSQARFYVDVAGNMGVSGNASFGGTLTVAQHTPASSSEPCQPGQTADDARYHYWCATPNHWLRVAGTSF